MPSDFNSPARLDAAPPHSAPPRATLMDAPRPGNGPAGLGAEAANPQIVTMQALAMIEQGTQLLSSAIPQLAPALTQLIASLRQVVPQAMADQVSGAMPGAGASPMGPGGPGGMGGPGMGAPAPSAPPTGSAGTPGMPM